MAIALVPLAVSPLGMNQFGPPKLLALALAASLIGLGFAIEPAAFAAHARRMARSRLAWALAAYFGIASLSVVTSVDRFHSAVGSYPEYQGLLRLVLWAVIAAGAASLAQRKTGWRLIARTVIVTLLAVGVVAWLQKVGIDTVGGPGGWSTRAWSTIGNPSHLGVWLVLALPFAAERFFADDHRVWRVCAAAIGRARCGRARVEREPRRDDRVRRGPGGGSPPRGARQTARGARANRSRRRRRTLRSPLRR